jgi:hypothetical protein
VAGVVTGATPGVCAGPAPKTSVRMRGACVPPAARQRFRFASLMSLAADDAGLPDDPEFRAALVGYLEWGTRLAMHNSQPGADVAQQAPGPH